MTTDIKEPASSSATAAPKSAREIAETMLGSITWIAATEGYSECPGHEHHTSKEAARDCMVFLNGIPTLHCVHASCTSAIDETNRKLRKAVTDGVADGTKRRFSAEEKARIADRERKERIRIRAAYGLAQVLGENRWTYDQIVAASPVKTGNDAAGDWRFLLQQFKPDDVVWIGDKFDSGKPEHACHFRAASDWLKETAAPGPFTCPVAFKNNSTARSNDNVLTRRFVVVESDTLTKDEVGAIFKWMKDRANQELVAIVDTAGKSLHGWFKYPKHESIIEHLKLVLPAYGCDPKLFTASQPVRLPGALRDGKYQKLIYLTTGGVA